MIQAKTLPGFMELLPSEQILFNQMKEKIQKSYEKFGNCYGRKINGRS